MPSDPVKAFSFLFYIQITFETHRRAKRGTHRHAKRERERERRTHRRSGTVEREREREREERVGRVSSGPTLDTAARSRCQVHDAKFLVRAADLSLSWSPSPFWTGSDRRRSAWSPITLSPICFLANHSLAGLLSRRSAWSLWSLFFFFFFFVCSGMGGGVLVVSELCGGGFCDIKFVWKLRKWLRKYEKFVGK